MKSTTIISFLLVIFGVISVRGQSGHQLVLYDGVGGAGTSVSINNYVDNLQSLNFNDIASSLCIPYGIWLLYENPSYNTFSLGNSAYFWGENYCTTLASSLNNLVSSVRYAGPVRDFKTDSVTIYNGEFFQSYEDYNDIDRPSISGYSGSLIVTGRSSWTLYESPNYVGYHVCVLSADITFADPGFYPADTDFGFRGRSVRSVRKGCFTADKSVIKPQQNSKAGEIHFSNKIENSE